MAAKKNTPKPLSASAAKRMRQSHRQSIRENWKTTPAKHPHLDKLAVPKQPSTMDAKTHKHFSNIVSGMIDKHQKKHGLSGDLVKRGFYTVEMPAAYRQLKKTHAKDENGKWKKI